MSSDKSGARSSNDSSDDMVAELTQKLESLRPAVTAAFEEEFHEKDKPMSIHTLNAYFGSYNTEFIESKKSTFANPEEFQEAWFLGLRREVEKDLAKRKEREDRFGDPVDVSYVTIHRLTRLLQQQPVKEYALLYLERSFLKGKPRNA